MGGTISLRGDSIYNFYSTVSVSTSYHVTNMLNTAPLVTGGPPHSTAIVIPPAQYPYKFDTFFVTKLAMDPDLTHFRWKGPSRRIGVFAPSSEWEATLCVAHRTTAAFIPEAAGHPIPRKMTSLTDEEDIKMPAPRRTINAAADTSSTTTTTTITTTSPDSTTTAPTTTSTTTATDSTTTATTTGTTTTTTTATTTTATTTTATTTTASGTTTTATTATTTTGTTTTATDTTTTTTGTTTTATTTGTTTTATTATTTTGTTTTRETEIWDMLLKLKYFWLPLGGEDERRSWQVEVTVQKDDHTKPVSLRCKTSRKVRIAESLSVNITGENAGETLGCEIVPSRWINGAQWRQRFGGESLNFRKNSLLLESVVVHSKIYRPVNRVVVTLVEQTDACGALPNYVPADQMDWGLTPAESAPRQGATKL